MGTERRKLLLLGALGLALAIVVYQAWPRTALPSASASSARGAAPRSTGPNGPKTTAPDVHLQALDVARPRPETGERNLFRFTPQAPPPPPPQAVRRGPPIDPTPVPSGPPQPAPPPPIGLKFIGIVEAQEHAEKIAVLSDGRSVFHGREGDIIEGRYRIVRIGVESIEMMYLDGRGRQTIRLSGS
jgi:hypothetical protein